VFGPFILLSLLLVSLGPSAHAETTTVRDRVGDVVQIDRTNCGKQGSSCSDQARASRGERQADILWAKTKYSTSRLTLQMKVRQLRSKLAYSSVIAWEIAGRAGSGLSAQISYDGQHREVAIVSYQDDNFACRAATGTVRARRGLFTLVIPARCLSGMDWVRVAPSASVWGVSHSWFDVPGIGRELQVRDGSPVLRFGSRVYRGARS
jgi:hypothetical protein